MAGVEIVEQSLVRAPDHDSAEPPFIEYDSFSATNAKATVEFGLLLNGMLEFNQLVTALESTLRVFPYAAGRHACRDGKTMIVGNNAGVPVSHAIHPEGKAPSFTLPLPVDLFDMVQEHYPVDDEPAPGALLRLRLTDFTLDGRQSLGVSFSHGAMDASSAGTLLAVLAAHCRGAEPHAGVRFDRIAALPKTPGPSDPPLSDRSEAPAAWQAMHIPATAMTLHEQVPMAVLSRTLTQDQCASLKARMADSAEGSQISTNDALVADLLVALSHVEKCSTPGAHLVVGIREALGIDGLWGKAVFTQGFDLPVSEAAAGELRRRLPLALDKDYIHWKFGQATCAKAQLKAGDFRFNSWVKAIYLPKLDFGPGGASVGCAVGISMWRAHAPLFGRARVSSCIVTPAADGVVLSLLTTGEYAMALVEAGFGNDVFALE